MKKWTGQIAALAGLALALAAFFFTVYFNFTVRCENPMGDDSIAVADYVPHDRTSKITVLDELIPEERQFTEEDLKAGEIPVFDGAAALLPYYAAVFQAICPENAVIFKNGTYAPESAMQYHNTRGAYQALADGTADILICVAPSQEQIDYAAEKGVEFELTPIGYEAFVFLVNRQNPVENLSEEELRSVFSGRIRNWAELGGPNRRIHAIKRNKNSGSQTRMEKFMKGEEIVTDPWSLFGPSIGFSFRYYAMTLTGDRAVKMLSVNGIEPNSENIVNGSYPLTTPIYAVTRKGETKPGVRKALDFMLSPEGQRLMEMNGYTAAIQTE